MLSFPQYSRFKLHARNKRSLVKFMRTAFSCQIYGHTDNSMLSSHAEVCTFYLSNSGRVEKKNLPALANEWCFLGLKPD